MFKSLGPLACTVSNVSLFITCKIALNQCCQTHREQNILLRDSWHLAFRTGTTACFCYAFRLMWMRLSTLCKLVGWLVRAFKMALIRIRQHWALKCFVRTAEILPVFLSAAAPSLSEPLWDWPSALAAHDESRLAEPKHKHKFHKSTRNHSSTCLKIFRLTLHCKCNLCLNLHNIKM